MTKISSFTEAVRFSADSFVPASTFSSETQALVRKYATATFDSAEAKDTAKAEIIESLSEPAKAALASIGAELPFDAVEVKLDLGSFLFDLYIFGTVQPSAPLAVAAHQRRLQNLATRLESPEITLKPEELQVIKNVLEDDEKWKSLKFNCFMEVKNDAGEVERKNLTLTVEGIRFYNKTLNAAVKLFEAPDETQKQATDSAQDTERVS